MDRRSHSYSVAESAIQAALTLVSRRALSAHELRSRLERKGFSAAEQADAVAAMQRYGYIDDVALAERTAAAAMQQRRGPLWVQNTLRRRGVPSALWEGAIAQVDDAARLTAARSALARRFGRLLASGVDIRDPKFQARACRFLCNRGFTPNCARAAVLAGPSEVD